MLLSLATWFFSTGDSGTGSGYSVNLQNSSHSATDFFSTSRVLTTPSDRNVKLIKIIPQRLTITYMLFWGVTAADRKSNNEIQVGWVFLQSTK